MDITLLTSEEFQELTDTEKNTLSASVTEVWEFMKENNKWEEWKPYSLICIGSMYQSIFDSNSTVPFLKWGLGYPIDKNGVCHVTQKTVEKWLMGLSDFYPNPESGGLKRQNPARLCVRDEYKKGMITPYDERNEKMVEVFFNSLNQGFCFNR